MRILADNATLRALLRSRLPMVWTLAASTIICAATLRIARYELWHPQEAKA